MRPTYLLALSALVAVGCASDPDPVCADGGTFPEQQFGVTGLYAAETAATSPGQITLGPAPTLVDADVSTSTGIDLGYGRTLASDTAQRDIGLQLDSGATVDALHVWVDRALPPDVAIAYAWSAYRSDDNVSWTAIAAAGPVVFADQSRRFEVPIARTQARYAKVVVRPLAAGITTDSRLASVLVTELQAFALWTNCNAR
jgi:hypothetical protein